MGVEESQQVKRGTYELAVLNLIINNSEVLDTISYDLTEDHFTFKLCKETYKLIQSLQFLGEEVTYANLGARATNIGLETKEGEQLFEFIQKLSVSSFSDDVAKIYLDRVVDNHNRTKFRHKMKSLQEMVDNEKETPTEDLVNEVLGHIQSMEIGTTKQATNEIDKIADSRFQYLIDLGKGKIKDESVKTSFSQLDELIGGFKLGSLNVLAARPSFGKTACMLSIAVNVSKVIRDDRPLPVLLFSLEMTQEEMFERILSQISMVEHGWITKGFDINDTNRCNKVSKAKKILEKTNIHIVDSAHLNVEGMISEIAKFKRRYGKIGLVAVDYIQIINSSDEKSFNREQEISSITRKLKLAAMAYKVPILALAQLSREVERREDKRPMLSDLRGSGAIEQDANTVTFIHRPRKAENKNGEAEVVELVVAKNRSGATGIAEVAFIPKMLKFMDVPNGK